MYDFIVPQELNISDRIGKFTFTQIGFLGGSLLIVLVLFMSNSVPGPIKFSVGIPVGVIGVTLAFATKYGLPIYQYLIMKLSYAVVPKEMIYSPVKSVSEFEDADYEYFHQDETDSEFNLKAINENFIFE